MFRLGDKVKVINLPEDFNIKYYGDALGKEGIITGIDDNVSYAYLIYHIDNNEYRINFREENLQIIDENLNLLELIDNYIKILEN